MAFTNTSGVASQMPGGRAKKGHHLIWNHQPRKEARSKKYAGGPEIIVTPLTNAELWYNVYSVPIYAGELFAENQWQN
jgi:hypothetical protein